MLRAMNVVVTNIARSAAEANVQLASSVAMDAQ